jgi:hypothetical protein
MMNSISGFKWHIIFIPLFFCSLYGQITQQDLEALELDFKKFRYQEVLAKGRFFLESKQLSGDDSLQIYQYMINAAYALNDTTQAKEIIREVLQSSREFQMDPRITSPKIIEFFNYVKNEQLEFPQVSDTTSDSLLAKPAPIRMYPANEKIFASFLVPGTGHLWNGSKTKGIIYTSASALFIGSLIYFANRTAKKRDLYMNARLNTNFNDLYDDYNRAYRTRNLLILGYGIFNLYVLYDLLNVDVKQDNLNFLYTPRNKMISFRYSRCW